MKSKLKIALIAIVCASILSGCASWKSKDDLAVKDELSTVANEVYSELKRLNDLSKNPKPKLVTGVVGCTNKIASLDFDGDIMLFIDNFNKTGVCKVRVVGKKPQQDLILSLHHKKVPVWQILEDASVQLGRMASISVGSDSVLFQMNGGVQQ